MPLSHSRVLVAGLVLIALLVGAACGGGKEISRDDYSGLWPFTIHPVTLHCEADAVWVEGPGGWKYALNGWAQTYLDDDRPLERIWRKRSAATDSLRVDIGPFIREGLALC